MTYVALDIGSTNSRAWLVHNGEIVARDSAPVGVRDSAVARSNAPVIKAARTLIASLAVGRHPTCVVGAGMLTSSLGLAEVLHIPAPADATTLAAGMQTLSLPAVTDLPVHLVPGVRTEGGGDVLDADVMRGEETLVVGLQALARLPPTGVVINVGSHWKVITTDTQGRIVRSRTTLGGELLHVVSTQTVLADAVPSTLHDPLDSGWLRQGAEASAREGLSRTLFGTRLLQLHGGSTPAQRQAWTIGAVVGADVQQLMDGGLIDPVVPVVLTGVHPLTHAWRGLLSDRRVHAAIVSPADAERALVAGLTLLLHHVSA